MMLRRALLAAAALLIATDACATDATTTNYGWSYPTVNADATTWGTTVNNTIIAIDAQMFLMAPKASPTFTGTITGGLANLSVTGGGNNYHLTLSAAAGQDRAINLRTAGVDRWWIDANGDPESTGNAGSNFSINRYADNGSTIDAALLINRATGLVTLADGLAVSNGITGALTGAVTGNASTATTLATGRTIAITGDLAYTSPTFNGSGNVTAAGTLATVNSNVGSFTNATVTVNAKGLVTAASSGTTGGVATAYANVACSVGGCSVGGGSLNVASVTRSSAGVYIVNFGSAYPDAHYVPLATPILAASLSVAFPGTTSVEVVVASGSDLGFSFVAFGT